MASDYASPNEHCPPYFERPGQTARNSTRDIIAGLRDMHLRGKHNHYAALPIPLPTPPPLIAGIRPGVGDAVGADSSSGSKSPRAGLDRGVSVSFLVEMAKHVPEGWSTQQVVDHIIIPASEPHKGAFLDIPGIVHGRFLGPPIVLVAHSWQGSFHALTSTISAHAAGMQQQCYWVDVLAVPLHSAGIDPDAAMAAGLRAACKSISMGLAVIDDVLEGGGALGDVWPLFQLWSILQGAKALDVASTSGVDGTELNRQVLGLGRSINISQAHAVDSSQRDFVLRQLHGSFSTPEDCNMALAAALQQLGPSEPFYKSASIQRASSSEAAAAAAAAPVALFEARASAGTPPPSAGPLLQDPQYQDIINEVYSGESQLQYKGSMAARKLLSKPSPPIDAVLRAGLLPRFVLFIQDDKNPQLQLEAAWAITNIASGTTDHTREVVNAGAIPPLISLMGSKDVQIREQVAWAIGNLGGDGVTVRDEVIALGGPLAIARLLKMDTVVPAEVGGAPTDEAKLKVIRTASWAASNLVRNCPSPRLSDVASMIAPMRSLLLQPNQDKEVLEHAATFFCYITDTDSALNQLVADQELLLCLSKLITHNAPMVGLMSIRALGNFAAGNDRQTQASLDVGMLPQLKVVLEKEDHKGTVKDAAWAASNVLAGTNPQIQAVLDAGLAPLFVRLLAKSLWPEVRKECMWCVSNLSDGGTPEQVRSMMGDEGSMAAVVKGLTSLVLDGVKQISAGALVGIKGILKAGKALKGSEPGGTNPFVTAFLADAGLVTSLEQAAAAGTNPDAKEVLALLGEAASSSREQV